MYYEFDSEPYALSRDEEVEKIASKFGVSVKSFVSHTLYDPRVLKSFFNAHPSTHPTYKNFLSRIASLPKPEKPAQTITQEIMKQNDCITLNLNHQTNTIMSNYVHSKSKKYELNHEDLEELQGSTECEKKVCKGMLIM